MARNNYNKIARYYDRISRLVYGNAIKNAQEDLVHFIKKNSSVLILGGGTGWILEAIAKQGLQGVSVTYVEISEEMIALARKRNFQNVSVEFINIPAEIFSSDKKFDVIFSPFFFDNFSEEKIKNIFYKINGYLKKEGLWLFADFYFNKSNSPFWQKFLLKTMYLFFRITANIEAQKLVDMRPIFLTQYELIHETFHYHHFIQAIVWRKK